jgi:hypothetical protein
VNLSRAIQKRYPNADPLRDFAVQDDGDGQKLVFWNEARLGPRPAPTQLESAWLLALKDQKSDEIASAFAAACRCDLGGELGFEVLGDVLKDNAKRQTLATHLTRLKALKKQADAATTEEALRGIAW